MKEIKEDPNEKDLSKNSKSENSKLSIEDKEQLKAFLQNLPEEKQQFGSLFTKMVRPY